MNLVDYLINNDVIAVQAEAQDWQQAVKLGTDMLERSGAIGPEYYQSICNSMAELGPYFLLGPGLAMPHARPEEGVKNDSYALVVLKEPVNFGDSDNDPIDILLTMAATSSKNQNEEAIVQIVELLDNEERIALLRAAKNTEDVKRILESLESMENT